MQVNWKGHMKKLHINQLLASLTVAAMAYIGFNGAIWMSIASGACTGLVIQTIVKVQEYRTRRETALALIEKKLAVIQETLKSKPKSDHENKPMCIVVQDIISQKTNDERHYLVLTDPLSDSDWCKLMNTNNYLKHATRVQALFPSQPSTLANRTHSHFISDHTSGKSFYFPSQLISFN